MLGQRGQPLVGGLGEGLVGRVEEVGVGALATSAHPTPQLVELGQPEGIGALDDHRVGVGDIESRLHNRRTNQDVEPLLPEVEHHLLELVLPHLSVRRGHPGLGYQFA